jgi:hypothetical protein
VPAQAGIRYDGEHAWTPASAGVTVEKIVKTMARKGDGNTTSTDGACAKR